MVSPGRSSASIKDVSLLASEAEIASFYLGIHSIPIVIHSPLREDRNPSFGIYSPDGTKVKYIDFSTRDNGDIFTLLMKMWNMPLNEVCNRILDDFSKNLKSTINVSRSVPNYRTESTRHHSDTLRCKTREWRDYDLKYWASYGIPLEWLKYADVYPISHKIILRGEDKMIFGADKHAYVFVEYKEGRTSLKIYQPYNKKGFKWTNSHDKSVISLWTKVPEYGEMICICSSLKDALCLWANTGIPALAIQGEGYGISDTAINELKRRYKKVYILLDNDEAGLLNGDRLSKSTGFINIVLPKEYGAKDISDLFLLLKDKNLFNNILINLFS